MQKLDAIKYTLGSVLIILYLSGCLNYEQVTILHTDGSGEMYAHVWKSFRLTSDSTFNNFFNEDSLKKGLDSNYVKTDNLEIYKDFRDSTIHAKIEISFQLIDSLNNIEIFRGLNFSFKRIDSKHIEFSQNNYFHFIAAAPDTESVTVEYIYYIPGEVVEHNADDLSNNKLSWKFDKSSGFSKPKLYAKFIPFKLKETPLWIYLSALFVLVVVIVYLLKKRDS